MSSYKSIVLFAIVSISVFHCAKNPASYDVKQTGIVGHVRAINTGGPAIPDGIEYKGICKIALLNLSEEILSEFHSDGLGKFTKLSQPGTYYIQVLSPKISDFTGPYKVTKNELLQVVAIYDMKLK